MAARACGACGFPHAKMAACYPVPREEAGDRDSPPDHYKVPVQDKEALVNRVVEAVDSYQRAWLYFAGVSSHSGKVRGEQLRQSAKRELKEALLAALR